GTQWSRATYQIFSHFALLAGSPPRPAVVRARCVGGRAHRDVESALELHLLFPVSHVFRNSHPAMKEMEVPQVLAWAEANKPRIQEFIAVLDDELKDRRFVAGDTFTVADITGLVAVDFMKPAKLAVPDDLKHLKRWHADIAARPSAAA